MRAKHIYIHTYTHTQRLERPHMLLYSQILTEETNINRHVAE